MTDAQFSVIWDQLERWIRSDLPSRVQAKAWLARLCRTLGQGLPDADPVDDSDIIPDLSQRMAEARQRELEAVRIKGDLSDPFCPVARFFNLHKCNEIRQAAGKRQKAKERARKKMLVG